MIKGPRAIVMAGYGLNCEEETRHAFEEAGAKTEVLHINAIINRPNVLDNFNILIIPGGFSFGDHIGAGAALAILLRTRLKEALLKFIDADKLVIGICNGAQTLVKLGVFEDNWQPKNITIVHNNIPKYKCTWITVKNVTTYSPWLLDIDTLSLPIAHGEGRFYYKNNAPEKIALQYVGEDSTDCKYNPAGSAYDTAAIADSKGKILAMMPHPERALYSYHRYDYWFWSHKLRRLGRVVPKYADGFKIIANGVRYFA